MQRPLWASTSVKDPALPGTRYVDELIVRTPSSRSRRSLAAVTDHGALARTVDRDLSRARDVLRRLAQLGIDLDEVSTDLQTEGVSSFVSAFSALRGVLEAKAAALAAR